MALRGKITIHDELDTHYDINTNMLELSIAHKNIIINKLEQQVSSLINEIQTLKNEKTHICCKCKNNNNAITNNT